MKYPNPQQTRKRTNPPRKGRPVLKPRKVLNFYLTSFSQIEKVQGSFIIFFCEQLPHSEMLVTLIVT